MISLQKIRQQTNYIVVIGNHSNIIQSILDFDYLSGKHQPSIIGVVTGKRGFTKYFFGRQEILIPTHTSTSFLKSKLTHPRTNYWFLNLLSGRRTLQTTLSLPNLYSGLVIFAENVPEQHSLNLIQPNQTSSTSSKLIIGPASVGLVVPQHLKLGPIGGITPTQIKEAQLTHTGSVAVLSASGGMTNELINVAIGVGHQLSFALSFGGDRFPILSPREAFLLAQSDPQTKLVLYYGELGGEDEYELIKLKQAGKFTKPVIAHIAGTVSKLFKQAPQFGHAKAKASKKLETATAKRQALKQAGFQVSSSFSHFIKLVEAST